MTITATCTARTAHPGGGGIATLVLRYPQYIHPQFLTHRTFSRNSQSARAMSFTRYREQVADDPVPLYAPAKTRGMVPKGDVPQEARRQGEEAYLAALQAAIRAATDLHALGYHQEVVNRLLSPFAHITTLVTAEERDFEAFFDLRTTEGGAQQAIAELATAMKRAIETRPPLTTGSVHYPFQDEEPKLLHQLAAGARVSYGRDIAAFTPEQNEDLVRRLARDRHMSPFEHVVMVTTTQSPGLNGNLRQPPAGGYVQFRKVLEEQPDLDTAIGAFYGLWRERRALRE